MRRWITTLFGTWMLSATALPQDPASPPPLVFPRTLGQAQTPEEWDAWKAVNQAENWVQKAELAQQFLEQYPESGLAPYAHHLLARYYHQSNQFDQFMEHAAKTVEELPGAVDVGTPLAFYLAERGQAEEAIRVARQGLPFIERLEAPAEMSPQQWEAHVRRLKADTFYALGRAYLEKFTQNPAPERPQDPNLLEAVQYLQQATQLDARHDYAFFRLGYALLNQEKIDESIRAYVRAAAVGGLASAPAREQLNHIYQVLEKDSAEIDTLIEREKEELRSLAANQPPPD